MSYIRGCLVLGWMIASGCTYYECDRRGGDDGWRDAGMSALDGGSCATDCAPDERCADGACVPAPACRDDGDCAEDERCERGACVDAGSCRDASQCGSGELCVDGACLDEDDTCHFDVDCGAGRRCVDAACRPICSADAECPSGTACDAGLCMPVLECGESGECDAGERCAEGQCLPRCSADADCPHAEEVCRADGLCHPDIRPRPFCASDADCAEQRLCLHGVCRTPCPSGEDRECFSWDSQFVRCGVSDVGLNLCYTHHETHPECRTDGDCAAGETCIDAICH